MNYQETITTYVGDVGNYREITKDALDVVLNEVSQTQTIDSNLFDLYTDLRGETLVSTEWTKQRPDFQKRINRLRLKLFLEDVERFLTDDKLLFDFICQDPIMDPKTVDMAMIDDIQDYVFESISSLLMPRHGPVILIYQAVRKLGRYDEFINIPRYKSQILEHFKSVEEFEYYLLRPFSYGLPFDGLFEKPDPDPDLDGSSPKPKQQTTKKAVTTSKSVKKTKNTKK